MGRKPHTYEYIYNYFKEHKCELLENDYINANTKMKYICECKNKSEIRFNSFQQGKRCNLCKNTPKKKLFNLLKHYIDVETQVKFDWCHLPFDFVLENRKIIIELDDKQHFEQETQIIDTLKNNLANKNGYRIIRICQRIVLSDKDGWEVKLHQSINSDDILIKIGSVYY